MERPLQRLRAKTGGAEVHARNDHTLHRALGDMMDHRPAEEDHADFWEGFHDDLEDHAHHMEQHSRRARKLAEVVRTCMIEKKAAGRVVPRSVHYIQTTTKKSDRPFRN
jgi:hypothetical protein